MASGLLPNQRLEPSRQGKKIYKNGDDIRE